MQKILSIVWFKVLPPVYGGQKGIALFNEYLGRKTKLTCLCSKNNTPDKNLSYHCITTLPVSKTQFLNPVVKTKILNLIKKEKFTHVIIENPYHAWLGAFKNKLNFSFIVHAHNIEAERMKQRRAYATNWVAKVESKAFETADFILFKTKKDLLNAQKLYKFHNEKAIYTPYGTELKKVPEKDLSYRRSILQKFNLVPNAKLFLFSASFDYAPNIKALQWIANYLLPELKKTIKEPFYFLITGLIKESIKKIFEHYSEIIFCGYINNIDNYFSSADVFINPVNDGSGIQTKNIDAIANNLTVVGFEYSKTGLPLYLINNKFFEAKEKNATDFCNKIQLALNNTTNTPEEFYKDFNWEYIIENFIKKCLE